MNNQPPPPTAADLVNTPESPLTVDVAPIAPPVGEPLDLDQLIPRPPSPNRRAGFVTAVVLLFVAFNFLADSGYLIPTPGDTDSTATTIDHYWIDDEAGLVGFEVQIYNQSERTVHLESLVTDAPGVEVVRAEAFASGSRRNPTFLPLPHEVPPAHTIWGIVWFRPTTCIDGENIVVDIDGKFSFGGGFPALSRTSLVRSALWGSYSISQQVDGEAIKADGPLALACEVLQ